MNESKIRNAVCAVLSFENKIFYVRRQNYLRNFPGYHSFPGGKVNKKEKLSSLFCDSSKKVNKVFLGALEREVSEELGFSLSEWQEKGFLKSIHYIAEALTPEFNPYRFSTHYFFIEFFKLPSFTLDISEFSEGEWLEPFEFCELYENGKVLTVPPILELSKKLVVEEKKIEWINFKKHSEEFCPMLEPIKGLKQFMPLSNTLPPANRTNAFLIGDDGKDKILVDPSPRDKKELERFLKTVSPYGPTHLFITHHHKDHHEFAPEIARRWNLPMYMSELTHNYLMKKRGEDYLSGIELKFVKHGQVLTTSREIDVCVFAVPGHDLGQLALYPLDLSWFIAGDLFQGIGSVVIGGDESSMTKYFETLNKIIELSPYCVVPSHGIALGGTDILQKNLTHRQFREKQIMNLLKKNLSVDEMTTILYQGLPENLVKYAKANVISHLKKINKQD